MILPFHQLPPKQDQNQLSVVVNKVVISVTPSLLKKGPLKPALLMMNCHLVVWKIFVHP
jgi:hypothetical protein